jgi:hypothetical protein
MEVNGAAAESVLVQQLELDPTIARQCALAAADEDRPEEEVDLVDQACRDCLAGQLRAAD